MEFKTYAMSKLVGYKSLGWTIVDVVDTDDLVSFKSTDSAGIVREHLFSVDFITINTVDASALSNTVDAIPVKTKKIKKAIV